MALRWPACGCRLICPTSCGWASRRGRPAFVALGLVLLLAATGCTGSLAGRWRMVKCTPNRETFSIDHASFTSKGEYTANVSFEGRAEKEKGTFVFNGFNITFRPSAGGSRTFTAALRLKRLEIMDGKRSCVLEKQ